MGYPYDDRWKLVVDGDGVDFGASFGSVMAANVDSGGEATLSYDTSIGRIVWVLLQIVLCGVLVCGAVRPRIMRRRRTTSRDALEATATPIIALGGES